MLKGGKFYITWQKIRLIYIDIVALYFFKLCFSGATRHGDSRNAVQIRQPHVNKFIEVSCKVFSQFFSLKLNKVNSKNWGETNFEVSKKQKDVWDVFFKIKKKDDGDWN